MVEGTSFMGLGGPNLVKGATGQVIDSEPLGGARMHTAVSGVAHYLAKDDADCLRADPPAFRQLPRRVAAQLQRCHTPARDAAQLYGVLPADHRMPYEIEDVLLRIFRCRRLRRVPARVCARDVVRQRAARAAGRSA